MLNNGLALVARAARFAASGATLLAAVAVVGGVIDISTDRAEAQAQETETVELIAFAHPVPGHEVNSPFGLRRMPWEKKGRLHAGIDIAAPQGAPVVATTDGIVRRAGVSPSYGRFVEVAHGQGLVSFYAHLDATLPQVVAGRSVGEGEKIAMVGSTGRSTGPHLHFEMRRDGQPLDPAVFVDRTFHPEALPFERAAEISPVVRIVHASRRAIRRATGRG